MNISWQWLAELIDLTGITPEYLAERLTLASFEVESINNLKNDTILEISTTANRADTLSMMGITREIGAILKRPYKKTYNQRNLNIKHQKLQGDYQQCTNHIYTSIHNIEIQESPQWLQNRLIAQDIKPENNIKDILKFICFKWGQYIEVFDINKITTNQFQDSQLYTQSKVHTESFIDRYNNRIINYPNDSITTIKYKNTDIALAGITPSKQSDIDHKTTNIIIQATICDNIYIKNISKQLNIKTNESIIQEKGINESDLLNGYNEAILLITKLCGGYSQTTTYESHPIAIHKPIYVDSQDILDILGPTYNNKSSNTNTQLNLDTISKILNNLNLITYSFNHYLQINIPLGRINDIYRDIDIIEEITRIYGFDKFIDQLPITSQYGVKEIQQYNLAHIRSTLRSMGLHESIHSSLLPKINKTSQLEIYNPLTTYDNNLKDNLLTGLIESYIYNHKQGNDNLEIFETGRIFNKLNNTNTYQELIHLAGILGGISSARSNWSTQPIYLSWFQAKGDIEEFFERINIPIDWQPINAKSPLYNKIHTYFHPKNIAILVYQEQPVGIFGEINFNLKKEIHSQVYGFEIVLNQLPIQIDRNNTFIEYSKYPSITRDININVTNNMPYSNIIQKINNFDEPLIESINLFDVYEHNNKDKNLGLRITYRSQTTTLTSTEVDLVERKIKNYL